MTGPHPDNPLLQALLDGTLTEAQQAGLESRLSAEPDLRDRLDALTSASDFSATFIPPEPTAPAAAAELTALIETLHASTPDTIPPPRDHTFDPTTHLAPPRNDDAIGSLGDYDILEIVGQGGMGIVFRAYDPLLQRPVAIKALSPALATSPAAREQFLREARSAAALDHSHILPIHAVDQQGILPYFVMPLVAGPTLQDLLKPGEPLPLTELARYATAVANALGSAHAAGIVHRDIKPANILTDPQSGRVWITDFGIAKPAGTPASSVNGTPHYISPEQARGEPTTPASDLFSLGVVLYEMATGSRPFDGGNTRAILAAVASHQPPPPSELNASVPPALDSLIIALLAKSPSDRPASAAGVSPVLENLTQPDHTWRRLGVLAITAIAITVTAVFLRPDETPATPPLPKPLFSLFGDGRSFPTLAGALAATTAGSSTVVINSNSTLESEPITTPPHPVVIRAARGTTPTLRFSGAGSPLFTATASLELRHLTVVQRPLRRAAENITPVISSSGASVTVTHCRIARIAPAIGRLPGGDFNLEVLPPVIRFEKASKLTVTRSEIYAIRGVCISTLIPAGSTSVHIDNSVIASRRFIETTAGTSASLTLTLDNNLLMASAVLDFLPNPTHPQLQASAHNNIFELRGGMVWARGRNPQEFAKTFSWDGSSNVYQIPHVAVHYGTAFSITNANRPSQHAFDTWTALPFVEETDSFSRNIKASERLDLHNTPLDTITASDFSFPPNSDELTSGSGPDAPYIGPGNTRLPRDGSALGKSL